MFGELLASLRPARGVGMDFSGEMVRRAARSHPELTFLQTDVHDSPPAEKFDFIILSDLVNDLNLLGNKFSARPFPGFWDSPSRIPSAARRCCGSPITTGLRPTAPILEISIPSEISISFSAPPD